MESSSFWDDDYEPDNLLKYKGYFCTESNLNEYILFTFDKDYIFKKIEYYNYSDYKEARIKKIRIIFLDKKKRIITSNIITIEEIERERIQLILNNEGRYIKIEFLENYGEKYFCMKRIKFYVDTYYNLN